MDNKNWEKAWRFTNLIVLLFKPLEVLVRYNIRKGMERLLANLNISHPSILELGAGTGHDSEWLIRKFGGKATLVDNCDYIIFKSKKYFKRKKLDVTYLRSNVEDIKYKNEYDLVFSVGLVEHFYKKQLYNIFKKHTDATKKKGYVMIFVPNKGRFYRSYKEILVTLKLWVWDEQPFSIKDLKNLGRLTGSTLIKTTNVIGGMWVGALYRV